MRVMMINVENTLEQVVSQSVSWLKKFEIQFLAKWYFRFPLHLNIKKTKKMFFFSFFPLQMFLLFNRDINLQHCKRRPAAN
jgi:hypothetical protein